MKTTLLRIFSGLTFTLLLLVQSEAKAQCTTINCVPLQTKTAGTATASGGGIAWVNPGNAAAAGNATASQSGGLILVTTGTTQTLTGSNFGFTVPATKHVCRFVLTVARSITNSGISVNSFVTDNSITVGGVAGTAQNWSSGSGTYTITANTTGTAVDAVGFGVALQALISTDVGLASTTTANVDVFSIQVFVHDTVIGPCPLPVELTAFDGKQDGACARIKWHTETESNNDYFLLEKLVGNEYMEVGRVASKESSTIAPSDYEMTDCNVTAINYYRLIQVDNDGDKTQVGDLIAVPVNMGNVDNILIVPNPAHEVACVASDTPIQTLKVISSDGRVVYERQVEDHINQECIPITSFVKGIYTVHVGTAAGISSKQLVVQ